ncbi:MAG: VOC family protein [Actinomycetota bacterium]
MASSLHPHLMFQNGEAGPAVRRYAEIFDDFVIDALDTYAEGSGGPVGQVQLAVCSLAGQRLTCFDSPIQHDFDMTPAITLFVELDSAEELDRAFAALADGGDVQMPPDDYGFSRRYGQLVDRHGVPWSLNLT